MYHLKKGLLASFLLLFLVTTACNVSKTTQTQAPKVTLPIILKQGLTAHGGLARWNALHTLEYTIQKKEQPEKHVVDLKSRKVHISHPDYQIGFDGKDVWVTPNKEAFGKTSPRFYHNLIFYFYAIPFVLADPGINYEMLPQKEIRGQLYDVVKISYNEGVGDAPDDYYIAHFNTETHLMDWLLYTVTYFSGNKSEKFNILNYEWQTINGLTVPSKMIGYKYADGQVGDLRYERPFTAVQLRTDKVNPAIFAMPQGAEIDALITH